jgi:cellulose synthase (UDP-forming)
LTLEVQIFCLTSLLVLFGVLRKPPENLGIGARVVGAACALVGYGMLLHFLFTFARRGHPFHNYIPYVFLIAVLLGNLNTILSLFFWPFSGKGESLRKAANHGSAYLEKSVTILVPTVNESIEILRSTLLACKSVRWRHLTVCVLDDGDRSEVLTLAIELGCQYFARGERLHAKAGNLNFGLEKTNSDLVVVFDADYLPDPNFLYETAAWFDDPLVGVVQTPQTMRQAEPIGRLLGVPNDLSESDVFYRFSQPIYHLLGAAICCGTACVFRRASLEAAGGFFCESSTEDYYTGIRINASGYKTIYRYDNLSSGLPPATITSYVDQRKRWARGTIQGLRTSSSPLRIPGLKPKQRLGHILSLLSWAREGTACTILLLGAGFATMGTYWFQSSWIEMALDFFPVYIMTSLLVRRCQGDYLPRVYGMLRLGIVDFQIYGSMILALLAPKKVDFRVSEKSSSGAVRRPSNKRSIVLMATIAAISCWGFGAALFSARALSGQSWTALLSSRAFFLPTAAMLQTLYYMLIFVSGIGVVLRDER